jgi:hypothetical protein
MPKLDRASLGEINAVARPQAAGLALEIRPIGRKVSVLVDKAVPDVNVDDASPFGVVPVKIIEIGDIGRRLRSADRRQPAPEHRHSLALERSDRVVDALTVELVPLLRSELVARRGRCRLVIG